MRFLTHKATVVVVLTLLVIGGGLAWFIWLRQKPDINVVGGTILVYEISKPPDKTQSADNKLVAEVLRRRFDADGLRHVTVVAGHPGQVEIRIPRVGEHEATVASIKDLVAQVGSLEFKILANQHDDSMGIKDAIDQVNNADNKAALDQAAVKGEPPLGPLAPGKKAELKQYVIDFPHNNKSTVTYGWVELGLQERQALGLDNSTAFAEDKGRKKTRDFVHSRLGNAIRITEPVEFDRRLLLQGAAFYGREVKDRNLPEEMKREKKYEYFVLARNPEIDTATGKETPAIDGSLLADAYVDLDGTGRPAAAFRFTPGGGELFGNLTGKNVPSGSGPEESAVKRHLAIVLDGLVMSAPTINSRITSRGMIAGNFTKREVERMVNILRSGALPAVQRPQSVREVKVEPQTR
jgi:preprotein translocase subunit SecD